MVWFFSKTCTSCPSAARYAAALKPEKPEPITAILDILLCLSYNLNSYTFISKPFPGFPPSLATAPEPEWKGFPIAQLCRIRRCFCRETDRIGCEHKLVPGREAHCVP